MTNAYLKLELPFCLYLDDGVYDVYVPEFNTTISVILSKFRRPSEIIDYKTFWRAELTEYGELWDDPNGVFRRSAATIIFPPAFVSTPLDPQKRAFHDKVTRLLDAAVMTLNRLIEIYRFVTEDTYIPIIQVIEIYNSFKIGTCFLNSENKIQYSGREIGFDNRLTNTRGNYDKSIHDQIRQRISNEQLIPLFEQIMINTHFQLHNNNWRTAIIEMQTAFEVFVKHHIRIHYLKNGYEEAKVDKIMECGLINLINDHLQKITEKEFTKDQTNYDSWYHDTYMMRNRIVHNGYHPTKEEAIQAVLGVEKAFTYLVNRSEKKFWPNSQPPTTVNEFIV